MEIKLCDYCGYHTKPRENLPITLMGNLILSEDNQISGILTGEIKEFCCDACALIWYIKEYKRYKRKKRIQNELNKSIEEIAWNKQC